MGSWLGRGVRERHGKRRRAELPRPAVRLVTLQVLLALLVAVGGLLLAAPGAEPKLFLVVVALIVLAQLLGLRMWIGGSPIHVGWGEAAIIVGFTLIPAQWIPAAVGVGFLLARVVAGVLSGPQSPLETIRAAAALTLSATVAATIVTGSGVRVAAGSGPDHAALTPGIALVLALAAVAYLLCSALFLGVHLAIRDGQSMFAVVWGALRNTPVMIVGNVALGLLAAVLVRDDNRLVWGVVPPLAWLMHQLYSHRLHEDEERRTWRAFALASRSLHRLDERAVAQEGIRAARALFQVGAVELRVFGSATRYRLRADTSAVDAEPDLGGHSSEVGSGSVSRPLEVAGGPVGVLSLRPLRPGSWGPNDQHRLAAFGDALAAALHDAATHSALRDLHVRVAHEAAHDPLTKLLNRDALLGQGDGILRTLAPPRTAALLLFDLDNFKAVNDTLGHLAGDELLQQTATRLADDAGPGELIARLGGDEFALLTTALPDEEGTVLATATTVAVRRARSLAASLAAPVEVAGVKMSADVSAGVAVATAGPVELAELLRRADIALYQAKETGARVTAYEAVRDRHSTDQLALVAELHTALQTHDQLQLVLQPAVDLVTGMPTGVEALVRWQHPRRGLLTPVDFVRAVEASDLLGQFTRYIIDQALRIAAQWADDDLALPIAVNLSPRSLLDPQLPQEVAALLRKHRLPARRLVLEITETVVLSKLRVTDEVLRELREIGVQFAVDDFGTGYSSLTFLTRIAVDELKVDRGFVARMGESKQAAAIVRSLIDLGRDLDLRVVAEGVETTAQRDELIELGCHAGQGFYFSRPVSVDQLPGVVRQLRAAARPIRAVRTKRTS